MATPLKTSIRGIVIGILVASDNYVSAFAPRQSTISPSIRSLPVPFTTIKPATTTFSKSPPSKNITNKKLTLTSTYASLAAVSGAAKSATRALPSTVRNTMLIGFALLLITQRQRILYPNSLPDRSFKEPLPPGTIDGCPYFGNLGMFSNMNKFFKQRASSLGTPGSTPGLFKVFGFASPMVIASGSSSIKKLLSHEFKKKEGISQPKSFGNTKYVDLMFGFNSMSYETTEVKKYNFLQRLVGQALTPESVAKAIPTLEKASEDAVQRMLASDKVVMSDINHYLTLDVAWRQIIGLNLKEDEIAKFHNDVQMWSKSITNYVYYILPIPGFLLKKTKMYKAKQALTKLINDKIDDIETNGPDGSTLSAMVTASDEEDTSKKLTRRQIIDNIFLLLVAGSETSSHTLTNAMLLLGMNPSVWDILKKEQDNVVATYGPNLTKDQLDRHCPYLGAVIKETMRILTISGGGARSVDETFVMNGYQLPKDWLTMYSIYNTHEQDPKTWTADGSHMDVKKGFRPERWLDKTTAPTSEYIPFGAGHRYCLGHHLATAEMRTFLAVMARKIERFDLLGDVETLEWKEGVIATPKDGVMISARARAPVSKFAEVRSEVCVNSQY